MARAVNLKEIEQKAYRAIQQDGLDGIIRGLSLALMALFFYDRRHGWAFVLGVGIQSWYWLKDTIRRRYTYPRVSYAKFLPSKSKIRVLTAVVGIVLMLSLAALLLLTTGSDSPVPASSGFGWILPLYAGVVLAGLAVATAHRYGYILDYIYAALFLESAFVGVLLVFLGVEAGKATAYQLWGLAVILIPSGLVQFIRFLHKYPPVVEEDFHGGE